MGSNNIKDLNPMTKSEILSSEVSFQEIQKHYREFRDKESSDKIFFLIYKCCKNIALKKAKCKVIYDLEDTIMDATLDIFAKWRAGADIKKLSSFCYLYVIGRLYDKKKIIIDREVSLDDSLI